MVKIFRIDIRPIFLQTNCQKGIIKKNDIFPKHNSIEATQLEEKFRTRFA